MMKHRNILRLLVLPSTCNFYLLHPLFLKFLFYYYYCRSPEQLNSQAYTKPSDVYSFAITVWEIMAEKSPFPDIQQVHVITTKVAKGERPDQLTPEQCPPEIWEKVIVPSWNQDPDARPTFSDLLPIVTNIYKDTK